jgi:hypothetical protein
MKSPDSAKDHKPRTINEKNPQSEVYQKSLRLGLLLPAILALQGSIHLPKISTPSEANHSLAAQTMTQSKDQNPSIQSLYKQQLERQLADKKEIIKNTFILEGWKEGGSKTASSNHGQEQFLTSACGITESTYIAAQKKWGVKNPKGIANMTDKDVIRIIDSEFMSPLEKHGQLPKSVLMMRFQAIWNLGEGKENLVWNSTLAQLKIKLGERIHPSKELEIINIYSKYQTRTNLKVHEPIYFEGLQNRVNKSVKLAQSMIKPKK